MTNQSIIISKSDSYFEIMIFQGILILEKSDIPMIIEEWGYSEIIHEIDGSEIFLYWKEDLLIIENTWGKKLIFNRDEFINLFLID